MAFGPVPFCFFIPTPVVANVIVAVELPGEGEIVSVSGSLRVLVSGTVTVDILTRGQVIATLTFTAAGRAAVSDLGVPVESQGNFHVNVTDIGVGASDLSVCVHVSYK